MDLKSSSKTLTDIYIISNTPSYLYETMRKHNFVSDYLAKKTNKELIKEFNIRIATSISNISEIAELYALLIALSFKKDEETKIFFKYVADHIKFEWFSKIAQYYFSNEPSQTTDNIQINSSPSSQIANQEQIKLIFS